MKFISIGMKTTGEIERTFGLNENTTEVHLALLEKAMVIENAGEGSDGARIRQELNIYISVLVHMILNGSANWIDGDGSGCCSVN